MTGIWAEGIELIRVLQSVASPGLDRFFLAVTFLGTPPFFLLLCPRLLWFADRRRHAGLLVLFLVSTWLNLALKEALQHPRPPDLVPEIARVATSGFGLPSGHAQSAVVIWGSLARRGPMPWRWACTVLVALIGISRVYLGVHFPTDVVAGWTIGAVILAVATGVETRVGSWWDGLRSRQRALVSAAAALALAVALPRPDPVSTAGVLGGSLLGLSLAPAKGHRLGAVPRLAAGLVPMAVVFAAVQRTDPGGDPIALALHGIIHAVLGFWVTAAAPRLFRVLRPL